MGYGVGRQRDSDLELIAWSEFAGLDVWISFVGYINLAGFACFWPRGETLGVTSYKFPRLPRRSKPRLTAVGSLTRWERRRSKQSVRVLMGGMKQGVKLAD